MHAPYEGPAARREIREVEYYGIELTPHVLKEIRLCNLDIASVTVRVPVKIGHCSLVYVAKLEIGGPFRFEPDPTWLPVLKFLDKPVAPAKLADEIAAILKE